MKKPSIGKLRKKFIDKWLVKKTVLYHGEGKVMWTETTAEEQPKAERELDILLGELVYKVAMEMAQDNKME